MSIGADGVLGASEIGGLWLMALLWTHYFHVQNGE